MSDSGNPRREKVLSRSPGRTRLADRERESCEIAVKDTKSRFQVSTRMK